jgi:hypothetical protein
MWLLSDSCTVGCEHIYFPNNAKPHQTSFVQLESVLLSETCARRLHEPTGLVAFEVSQQLIFRAKGLMFT